MGQSHKTGSPYALGASCNSNETGARHSKEKARQLCRSALSNLSSLSLSKSPCFVTTLCTLDFPSDFVYPVNMPEDTADYPSNQSFHHPSTPDIAILLGLAHKDE